MRHPKYGLNFVLNYGVTHVVQDNAEGLVGELSA